MVTLEPYTLTFVYMSSYRGAWQRQEVFQEIDPRQWRLKYLQRNKSLFFHYMKKCISNPLGFCYLRVYVATLKVKTTIYWRTASAAEITHASTIFGQHWLKWWLAACWHHMMTSSNGNIFRVTGPLCGEFTGPGEFPAQRPVTQSFDVFFHLRLNKRLSKQPWDWWFETPGWSLWRHRNETITWITIHLSHTLMGFYQAMEMLS